MDAHTEYPDDYLLLGRAAPRGGRDPLGQRARRRARPRPGVARGGAGAAAAARPRRLAQVERASTVSGPGVRARLRRVRRGVGARDAARVRRLGRALGAQPGLRDGGPVSGARRAADPDLRRWRRNTPRATRCGGWRASTSSYGVYRSRTAVRHPHTMRRSHLLAPSVVVTLAASVRRAGPVAPGRPRGRTGLRGGAGIGGACAPAAPLTAADAALVPAALAAMHFGHGVGALYEASPPRRCRWRRRRALGWPAGSALWPAAEPVFAPPSSRARTPRR